MPKIIEFLIFKHITEHRLPRTLTFQNGSIRFQ